MTRKHVGLLLLLLALMLALPMSAHAWDVDAGGFAFGAGEYYRHDFADFSSKFGANYTQDDFTITYTSTDKRVKVSEDGTLYMDPADWTEHVRGTLVVKYKLNRGNKSSMTFAYSYYIHNQFTGFVGDFHDVELGVGNSTYFDVRFPENTYRSAKLKSYDESVAEVSFSQMYYPYRLNIKGIAPGETDVVLEAYNGVQLVIHVTVHPAPTKITFTQEHFTLFYGDSIDVGTTMDGYHYGKLKSDFKVHSLSTASIGKMEDDNTTFTPQGAGFYTVTLTAYNGATGTFTADVYSHADSVRLESGLTTLNIDSSDKNSTKIYAFNAAGERIVVPLTITEGADVITLSGYSVIAQKEGTAVVTATTDTGATASLTFRVALTPNDVWLEEKELTLNVGESHVLTPVFDQGWGDVTYEIRNENSQSGSGQHVVKVDKDGRVTALCPGTVDVKVRYGYYRDDTCRITVPESNKRLEINRPEALGVGETFQLSVSDLDGNPVPAVFSTSHYDYLSVTEDGLMTGLKEGKQTVKATLEDGQVLSYQQKVVLKPTTMTGSDLSFALDQTYCPLGKLQSDIGQLDSSDVIVEVLDTRVATYASGKFTPNRIGSTQVRIASIYGGVEIVIRVTITEPNSMVYPDETTVYVPLDGYVKVPTVRDYYGKAVDVTSTITEVYNGGNPNGSTFKLWGGYVSCSWPSGNCTVTCTTADGRTCKIKFIAYAPPERLYFKEEAITVKIGETKQLQLWTHDSYGQGSVSAFYADWSIGNSAIARLEDNHPGVRGATVTGLKAGTTTVKATLANGVSATCTITVLEEETPVIIPAALKVYTTNNIRYMKANSQLQFLCDVLGEGTTHLASTEIVWSVSDPQAGSIDQNGLFTSAKPRYDMDVTITATSVHDATVQSSYMLMIDGELEGLLGDVNGDGTVDGRDVIRLLRYQTGEGVTIVRENSDVNGDGVIDGRDALRLLKSTM